MVCFGTLQRGAVMEIIIPGVNESTNEYADAKHERRPHGVVFVNGMEVATTLQCPHCGSHFVSRKGSGHRRTWCMKCEAVTCGRVECDPCSNFIDTLKRIQDNAR